MDLNNLILIEIYTNITVIILQVVLIPWSSIVKRKMYGIKIRAIISFTIPIYLNNLFSSVHRRFNLFIIGALLNPISVAYYDIGDKIPAAFRKMFNSFLLVFFPNVSNLFSKGENSSAEELIDKSLIIISVLLSIGVLISFLFGREIMILVFSEQYSDSSLVFTLLMLNLTLGALATILGYSNLSAGYPKVPMKVNMVSSVISLGGSLLMIPQFGYIGAAYSVIITNTLAQVLYILYLKKADIKVNVFKYTKSIVLLIFTLGLYLILNNDSMIIKFITVFFFLLLNWYFISDCKSFVVSIFRMISKNNF